MPRITLEQAIERDIESFLDDLFGGAQDGADPALFAPAATCCCAAPTTPDLNPPLIHWAEKPRGISVRVKNTLLYLHDRF